MLVRRAAAVVSAAALFAACSSSSPRAASSSAPSTTESTTSPATDAATTSTTVAHVTACERPHASGQSTESFDFDGEQRTYEIYVPTSYDGSTHVPLVLNFHGFGSNAKQQMIYGNFKRQADRDGFVVVAPEGQTRGGGGRHFNLTGERGLQNDVLMVGALLDHLERELCIDRTRIDSTGMSDGGAMTSVLACVMPNRIAAFAPVAVIVYRPGCGGKMPVPIMGTMGTADPVVPFNGGNVRCCGGVPLGSAPDAMAGWAAHDGCNATYTDTRTAPDVRKRVWHGCNGDSEVVFNIVDGGGHTWPGSIPVPRLGKTTTNLDASEEIWRFFERHPLAR